MAEPKTKKPREKKKPQDPKKAQEARSILEKREAFVRGYIENDFKDATGVYVSVYGCTPKAAAVSASRLLKDPNIQALMAKELSEVMKIARIPMEKRVVDTWMKRAFYDIADIVDEQGALRGTMEELKKSGLSVCIDGVDIKTDKDGGEHYVYKLADRDRALEMLQRYAQIIKPFDAKLTDPNGKESFTVEFVKNA